MLAASHAALDLHDPTLHVVPLAGDSLLDAVELPEGAVRRLVFEREDLWIDVALWVGPAGHRMSVHIGRDLPDEPATPSTPTAPSTPTVPVTAPVAVDELDFLEIVQLESRTKVALACGRAEIVGVPPGLTSLVLPVPADPATGNPSAGLRTAWFTV